MLNELQADADFAINRGPRLLDSWRDAIFEQVPIPGSSVGRAGGC